MTEDLIDFKKPRKTKKDKPFDDGNGKKRCPLDVMLACKECRWYQTFLGSDNQRLCSIVRIAHRMPL